MRRSSAVRSTRVLLEDDALEPATIVIDDGRINGIESWNTEIPAGTMVHDVGDLVVMPGLVDTHVHVNEPGRTEWEGFASATRAAAAGGVTTLLDMPLNSVPATTTVAALESKRAAALGKCWMDVGFLGGVIPGNTREIEPLWNAGVFAFKCFLAPSGVDEFPHVSIDDLQEALPILAGLDAVLMVHAEDPQELCEVAGDPCCYQNYLASRPDCVETHAIGQLIDLAARHRARIHIVHVSSSESLSLLREARSSGVHVTAETCPHYLSFSAEQIADGATEFKCAPPIRGETTRQALWNAVASGDISQVVSDHSPAPPDLKHCEDGRFDAAWGGIASLQLGLQAMWTQALQMTPRLTMAEVSRLMSANPARLVGLHHRKGRIAEGFDADFVCWDPDASCTVDASKLYHRHPLTPYSGRVLNGRVDATFVRGMLAYRRGTSIDAPAGQLLTARHS